MGRRVVIAALLAGIGVFAFLVGLVRSAAGSMHLCGLAQATLRDLSHQRVAIGRCEVDPFSTHLVLDNVEIGPEARPILYAERLTAGIETRALLSGRLRIDGVELLRPRVDADLDVLGPRDDADRERRRGARCLPETGVLEVGTISLVDGAVRVKSGERIFESRGLSLTAQGENTTLRLEARAGRTTLADDAGRDEAEEAVLRGSIDLASGAATLASVEVRSTVASVFANGRLDDVCTLRGSARGTLRADLDALGAHLLRDVKGLGGEVSAEWSADLKGADFRAEATLEGRGIRALGLAPDALMAKVTLTPGLLTLRSLDWPLETGTLHGSGTLQLAEPFQVAVGVTLEHVTMGEMLRRLGVADLSTHVEASGTGTAKGTLGGAAGFRLEGDLDLRAPLFAVYDRPWNKRNEPGRTWVRLERGTLKGRYVLEKDRVRIIRSEIAGGRTRAELRGTVWFGPRGLQLEYEFPQLDLADLGPYGTTVCEGFGSGHGTVSGPYRGLDIRASVELANLAVVDVEFGRARADGRLDLSNLTLAVTHAEGTLRRSRWTGEVFMDFAHRDTQGAITLHGAHLADLAASSRRYAARLGNLDDDVDLLLDGTAELSGPAAELDARGTFRVRDARIYGQAFTQGTLVASMDDNRTYRVDALQLERDTARIEASAEYRLADRGYAFEARGANVDVKLLDPLRAALPGLTGETSFEVRGAGTLDHLQGTARLVLHDWFDGAQPLGTARLDGALDGSLVTLEGTIVSPWPAGVRVPPVRPGAPEPRPPGSMLHELAGELRLTGDRPFTARVRFDVPDLHKVAKPGLFKDLNGELSGRMEASGTLAHPGATTASLVVERLRLQQGALSVQNSAPATARLEAGRLSIENLPLSGPGFELAAYGVREPDGRLDLAAEGASDLSRLHDLFPIIEDSSGHASLSVALTGRLEDPQVVGNATIDGLRLRLRDVPAELSNAHGSVLFSPTALVTDGLEGYINGARVTVDGHVDLDKFRPRDFELALQLGEIPLQVDDIPMVVSGRPVLRGTFDAMSLEGDLSLDRFRFQRDLELERTIVQVVELALQRRPPPVPRVFERSSEFLALDLGLHLGDVRVDNNLLKADLRGDLRLTGTNRRLGLLGAITLNDARAKMRNTEFDISSAVVNFTDRTRIRPAFDLRADAKVRDYLVHVAATGTAQQPRLLLSSEPALPEADILTLLTLGVTSRDFDRTDSASLGGFLIDAAYNASGLNDQLKKLLPGTEGLLDDANLRVTSAYSELSGNIEPVAQFEGKVRGADLKLRGQASLIGRGRRAQAELKVTDDVSGVFQVDSGNPSVPTADYGADFLWHVEKP